MIGALAIAGPPLQGGPDSPLGDLLGYVVLFVVVVWPIIRGVLDQAQGRRTEFERQQRKKRPSGQRTGGGRSLEEILRGDPYVEALEEPLLEDVVREIEPAAPPPLPREQLSEPSFGERPEDEVRPSERELVGDPFDDSVMGQDLVDGLSLAEVPSEDELEVDLDRGPTGPEFDARRGVGEPFGRRSGATRHRPRSSAASVPGSAAFVLKEILGAPAATRAFDDDRF